jgi:hypothetical protein
MEPADWAMFQYIAAFSNVAQFEQRLFHEPYDRLAFLAREHTRNKDITREATEMALSAWDQSKTATKNIEASLKTLDARHKAELATEKKVEEARGNVTGILAQIQAVTGTIGDLLEQAKKPQE